MKRLPGDCIKNRLGILKAQDFYDDPLYFFDALDDSLRDLAHGTDVSIYSPKGKTTRRSRPVRTPCSCATASPSPSCSTPHATLARSLPSSVPSRR